MKKLRQIITILFFSLPVFTKAGTQEIPFTLDDRDRIIRTEKEVTFLIRIFTTMMVSVLGFAFWDRKLSMAPIKKDNMKLLEVLRDYTDHQPKLREILKNAGLM